MSRFKIFMSCVGVFTTALILQHIFTEGFVNMLYIIYTAFITSIFVCGIFFGIVFAILGFLMIVEKEN